MAYSTVCIFEAVALPTAIEYLIPNIRFFELWIIQDWPVDLGFVLIEIGRAVVMTSRLTVLTIRVYNSGLEGVLGSGGSDVEAIHGGVSSG